MGYLLIEAGRTVVRAALIDMVEGTHRFVAGGKAVFGFDGDRDLVGAIRESVMAIENVTGRRLLSAGQPIVPQRSDGAGVDGAVLVSGEVMRVATMALTSAFSSAAAERAAAGGGIDLVGSIILDGETQQSPLEKLLQVLHDHHPASILLAGATDSGMEAPIGDLLDTLALGLEHADARGLVVLYAGNESFRGRLEEVLGRRCEIRCVSNILPTIGEEHLQPAREGLQQIWRDRLVSIIPGYEAAQSWSNRPILPTNEGLALTICFLADWLGRDVWVLDVGCSATSVLVADKRGVRMASCSVGAGRGAVELAGRTDLLGQLVPGASPECEQNLLWSRIARPWSLPDSAEEAALLSSLVRESGRAVVGELGERPVFQQEVGLVVARGGALADALSYANAVSAIVDGLNPVGVFEVALDRYHILSALATLVPLAPRVAAEVVLSDGIFRLGTVVRIRSNRALREPAGVLYLRRDRGAAERITVRLGDLLSLDLGNRQTGELSVESAAGVDWGAGEGKRFKRIVRGGPLGVLVDARSAPTKDNGRADSGRLLRWLTRAFGGERASR